MLRISAIILWFSLLFSAPAMAQELQADELPPEIAQLMERLDPKTGQIAIEDADATLDLGDQYVFYNEADTRDILVMLWGNPPGTADGVLGMVMPAGSSPLSDAWGAVISFEKTGYVSDDDAASTDYDELLENLQEGTRQSNDARKELGYPEITLVGWADSPVYDRTTHSVVWAQNLAFSDADANTLNYDVRTLGRYGVLSVNLVSSMDQLVEIREAAADFASHASFNEGARYQDFNPETDQKADYGIAGLIAGGAGAAALAKKTGLLGIIFAFLAKFGKFIIIGAIALFGVLWRPIKGFFSKDQEEYYEEEWNEDAQEPVEEEAILEKPADQTGGAAPDAEENDAPDAPR